ncbi:unnamed protein product [Bursaphelenchus okinawaensis]|uniref:Nose resistant-to-fluoxetine protein N-terminal domain-containing protein n=1 Tax=Bursaphelenchus okinawaensis TaxID=465554 RepID=A0A811L6J3_9BILA|nr:unnamed protein product [Bursaphelenchus okinawaensis]CAG9119099.1 unnamed protein product [Bursaphelenchus okinawaensis]
MKPAGFHLLLYLSLLLLLFQAEAIDVGRLVPARQVIQEYLDERSTENLYQSQRFNLIDIIFSLDANQTRISSECRTDMKRMQNSILMLFLGKMDEFTGKVISVLDSGGKPGAGLTKLNTVFEGIKDACLEIEHYFHDSERPFRGQFVKAELSYLDANRTGRCDNRQMNFFWDLCLPESCTHADLMLMLGSNTTIFKKTFYTHLCDVHLLAEKEPNWNYQSYITLGYMALLTGLVVIASLIDVVLSEDSKKTGGAYFISSFSIFNNISEIMKVKKNKVGQINQLHGIRFLSMCWIIMGHSLMISSFLSANLLDALQSTKKWTIMIPALSYYAVDTFFFQSGFLLGFLWFRGYDKSPKAVTSVSSWILFYVHRFFRLSPAYYIVIAFYTFVFSQLDVMVKSPMFLGSPSDKLSSCPTLWQYNLLYINNFMFDSNPCYIVSWYLATDMQLYIAAPLLIVPFLLSKPLGYFVSSALLIGSTAFTFTVTFIHKLAPYNFDFGATDPETDWTRDDFEKWMYNPPWTRCQPYIVGFLLGYVMHNRLKVKLNKIVLLIGWILVFAAIFAVYYPIKDWVGGEPMDLIPRSLYASLSRLAWSYIIGWVIFTCYYGYGGPVNRFLNWPGWVPLGRLSYCAYLIHLFIVVYFMLLYQHKLLFLDLVQMVVRKALQYLFTFELTIITI